MEKVPEIDKISFSKEEEDIYRFWKEIDAFQNSLAQSKNKPKFTFFDGPPFATGLPHYGHILAGTIKDVVTRWAHQTGHHVQRRFGWDTHGLPVEYEIDKTHNINGPEDVAKIGIKQYNSLCRAIINRYSAEWEQIISRLGRWIDFKNDYKTMYPWYMESIWWVFNQLYEKGFVYKGVKVMPFSTKCSTPISNFEAGQNYKDTQDPSVVVTFPLLEDESIHLVAWTTTPWTLPSNLSLCVNPDMTYVKVMGKTKEHQKTYIMMEDRICQVFKNEDDYEILSKFVGKDLEGKEYVPIFNYFEHMRAKGAFRVLLGSYVTSESGTGIVHQAPYFGEDDFRICLSYGIITKDSEPICPVDDSGKFKSPVEDFKGIHVKEADNLIIKNLRSRGRLVLSERVNHSYPYCWRSDTPLIYRAVSSWFIRVEHMQEKLLASNDSTYWVPNFVKEKRFANWLKDARDWAISRNRYWGTPIPIWVSEDMAEIVCIGSIAELEKLSGEKVSDLHRDNIDHITIPSKRPGMKPLKRITEVFDCWFESGAMPYAQVHYPFENKKEFEECFPANFIAEGIDQTRGWFYTLMVISTALFGKAPFKNLIVNGIVLASDGQKMSKRLKNYPDPMNVVNKYGADALRLYLMNSPSVRGENLRFKEEDVFSLLKEVFIPWLNAYRFFVQQVDRLEKDGGVSFKYDGSSVGKSQNVMDKWILSFTQSLVDFMHKEMNAFRLYTVTPRLIKFVDNLTNWYVRFNRKRLKGETGKEDCLMSLNTLYTVLLSMIRVMSPFTPFIAEMMYQNLKKVLDSGYFDQENIDSIHYLMVPYPVEKLICKNIEASVSTLQSVVELGRYVRDKVNIPLKYPLPEIIVIHKDQEILDDVNLLIDYIKDELNVRSVLTSSDKEKYGVVLKAELNFKLLGSRLKGDMKKVKEKVTNFTDNEIQYLLKNGSIEIAGHTIQSSELQVKYAFAGKTTSKYEAHSDESVLILLDTTPSQEMKDEGLAREITNRMQKLRKKAKLLATDDVTLWYEIEPADSELGRVAKEYHSYIEKSTKTPFMPMSDLKREIELIRESTAVKESILKMVITKGSVINGVSNTNGNVPNCSWINVIFDGKARLGGENKASILLENPKGKKIVSNSSEVIENARKLFGFSLAKANLFSDSKKISGNIHSFANSTLVVSCNESPNCQPSNEDKIFTKFINIKSGKEEGTLLLENPTLVSINQSKFYSAISRLLNKDARKVYLDENRTAPLVLESINLLDLNGKDVFV